MCRGWRHRVSSSYRDPACHRLTNTPLVALLMYLCSKSVPSFYINSHIDQCLAGGGEQAGAAAAAGGPSNSRAAAGGGGGGGARKQQPGGPFQPLALPAKLVPSLATEKSVRQLLRKYSMPTDGKKKVRGAMRELWDGPQRLLHNKRRVSTTQNSPPSVHLGIASAKLHHVGPPQELLERYSKLRLAVEMANDKQVGSDRALGGEAVGGWNRVPWLVRWVPDRGRASGGQACPLGFAASIQTCAPMRPLPCAGAHHV